MDRLATKRSGKTSRIKREREFFETDNQTYHGRVTFCYSLTSSTTSLWSVTGLTENAGHEIGGPSKLQGMKLQDMKLTDQCAGHEIAGRENDGPICRT